MAKITHEVLSEDVGISIYKITMSNKKKYFKTIEGYVYTWSGYYSRYSVFNSQDYKAELAGKWDTYEIDCGIQVNSKHIICVELVSTQKKMVHILKVTKKVFFGDEYITFEKLNLQE